MYSIAIVVFGALYFFRCFYWLCGCSSCDSCGCRVDLPFSSSQRKDFIKSTDSMAAICKMLDFYLTRVRIRKASNVAIPVHGIGLLALRITVERNPVRCSFDGQFDSFTLSRLPSECETVDIQNSRFQILSPLAVFAVPEFIPKRSHR